MANERPIKVSGALPKANTNCNGLDVLYDEMVRRPRGEWVAVVRFSVAKVVDHTHGAKEPNLKIEHIEGIDDADDQRIVEGILAQCYTRRNRKPEQPDLGFDLRTASGVAARSKDLPVEYVDGGEDSD